MSFLHCFTFFLMSFCFWMQSYDLMSFSRKTHMLMSSKLPIHSSGLNTSVSPKWQIFIRLLDKVYKWQTCSKFHINFGQISSITGLFCKLYSICKAIANISGNIFIYMLKLFQTYITFTLFTCPAVNSVNFDIWKHTIFSWNMIRHLK